MGTAKEVFLKDKVLADKWSGWVHGPDFERVLAFADGELVNQPDLTPDIMRGAKIFKRILLTLSEVETDASDFPKPGLNHDLDPKPRTKESLQQKK